MKLIQNVIRWECDACGARAGVEQPREVAPQESLPAGWGAITLSRIIYASAPMQFDLCRRCFRQVAACLADMAGGPRELAEGDAGSTKRQRGAELSDGLHKNLSVAPEENLQ